MRSGPLFPIRARAILRARAFVAHLARSAAGVLLAGVLLVPAAHSADLKGATLRITRTAVSEGGTKKTSASFTEYPSVGAAGQSSETSASFSLRGGFPGIQEQPGEVTGLWASSGTAAATIYLQWTAPGNDGYQGLTHAGHYIVKYAASAAASPAVSDANFDAAATVAGVPAPADAGTLQSMTIGGLTPGVTYYFAIKAQEADGIESNLSLGATAYASAGGPPSNVAIAAVGVTSVTASWTPNAAGGYEVDASSASDFTGLLFSSSTTNGLSSRLAPQGLWPNTTYYVRVLGIYSGQPGYASPSVTTATLATPPLGADATTGIWVTSMTVTWNPLPSAPPDASSKTAEGYVVDISTDSDFNTLWAASSMTPNVKLSTLTFTNLTGGNTYFFRVGSLNWNSQPSYAVAVSTLLPIQLGVSMTTHTVALGSLNMNTTVAISTSIILTNTGNVSETYYLRATTTTAGSPWKIGASQWVDQYEAWTVVNSTEAKTVDYLNADKLGDVEQACSATAFTMGHQSCVQVAPGATRTIWVQVATPLTTSTNAGQSIDVTARAVKDP